MKAFVFLIIVVTHFSDNGKASFDNGSSVNANYLLDDTLKITDNICSRPCKFNEKPRKCEFKFTVAPIIDDEGKTAIAINDMIPGPFINVCVNDIIIVEVKNKVPDQELAIHWHGIEQKGTPYMDGVPMVTQCPIGYGSTYKYAFRASAAGTFFYHADSVSQQTDGVFGGLVVNQPQPYEPHSSLYDYDRVQENTLMVSTVFPDLLTGNLEDLSSIKPTALRLNGGLENTKIFVMENFAYRLRLINAIGVDCPAVFHIDEHDMNVIAGDGKPVRAVPANRVRLYPGQRMDVIVRASKRPKAYWIHVLGEGICKNLKARGMLIYSGYNYTSMLEQPIEFPTTIDMSNAVTGQNLESLFETNLPANARFIYLGINKKILAENNANDYRYLSDAMPKKAFYPAALTSKESGVVQINGKNFLYPNVPPLLKPREVAPHSICIVGEEEKHVQPQCIQVLNVRENESIELGLINEDFSSNDSFVFHLHGNSMQTIAAGNLTEYETTSKEQFLQRQSDIPRNLINPPSKNTVVVPAKGYVIIRIEAKPGVWMLECRSCGLSSLPTAILINVPLAIPKFVVNSLPSCGNYRPPDVLLN